MSIQAVEAMIQRLEDRIVYLEEELRQRPVHPGSNAIGSLFVGKLDEDLVGQGKADFSYWKIDPDGGLDSALDPNGEILDVLMASTRKLASGAVIIGAPIQGKKVLINSNTCHVPV